MPGRAAWSCHLRVEWQAGRARPEDIPSHEHPGAQAWRPGLTFWVGIRSQGVAQQGVWALGVGC